MIRPIIIALVSILQQSCYITSGVGCHPRIGLADIAAVSRIRRGENLGWKGRNIIRLAGFQRQLAHSCQKPSSLLCSLLAASSLSTHHKDISVAVHDCPRLVAFEHALAKICLGEAVQ